MLVFYLSEQPKLGGDFPRSARENSKFHTRPGGTLPKYHPKKVTQHIQNTNMKRISLKSMVVEGLKNVFRPTSVLEFSEARTLE